MLTLTRTIAHVAALGLVACGAEPAVESTEYDDVAQMLASSLRSDVGGGLHGAIDDTLGLVHGTRPPGFSVDSLGWVSGYHGDATYAYQVTCADRSGHRMPACNASAESATVIAAWYGTTHAMGYDARFNRAAIWEFDHLQSGIGTILGVGSLGSTATFGMIGTPVTYTLATGLDETYLLDTQAGQVMAADLIGELGVVRNGERFAIDALVTLDRDAANAAIVLDGAQVLDVRMDTTFPGE